MRNVPDDWEDHFRICDKCCKQYHASEGGCPWGCDYYEEHPEELLEEEN